MTKTKIVNRLMKYAEEHDIEPSSLDEMVIDCKCSEASELNNSGMEAQIRYLLDELGKDAESNIQDMMEER